MPFVTVFLVSRSWQPLPLQSRNYAGNIWKVKYLFCLQLILLRGNFHVLQQNPDPLQGASIVASFATSIWKD